MRSGVQRAVVVREPGGPDVLRVEDVELPGLRPNEVRIRIEACGVCFHDVVVRRGTMKRGVTFPFIPGHEVAGVIVETGPNVRQHATGDRVATTLRRHICGHCRYCRSGAEASCPEREPIGDAGFNGGYANYVCVEEDNIALIPEGVSMEQACIAGCAIGTQLNAIRDVAKVRAGERVLLSGAGGGLGIHGVQLARLAGAIVIALTTSPAKVERIRAAGAHHVLLVAPGEHWSRSVIELTAGLGADVAIDNVGSALFHETRRSLAEGGRWVFVGQLTGDFVQLNPAQLFLRGLSILTAKSGSREQLRDVLGMIQMKQIDPLVLRTLSLERAAAAHELLERRDGVGRIVLKPHA